ncbi:DUF4476 domain-containing protein [Hymenobacter sp. UV11]|uniref:DUF4476 domain-containing protein n=1 Tax=Hymenobacter sp. UV11 TaxID=1849735 RepID=UPI00105C3408|nr:DUF4476 domain-containing protein [Hymenobacter sp. UV11]TDN36272.1 hypothetical protein A8B98_10175 [Hymenobacter sp. UV11]TFZ66981.1 DUF4476 domain-containing protein [Hymenobacter sp. UV11]
MKTFLVVAASTLLAWVIAAPAVAAPPANLTITAEQGQPFSLVLDGRLLTNPVARQIRVGLLVPGRHWAEISVPTGYGPPMRIRTSMWLQPGVETSYVLLLSPYGPQLRQVAIGPIGQPGYGYGNQGGYYGQGQGGYYGQGQQGGYYGQGQPGGGYYGQNQAPAQSQGGYYGQGQAPAPGQGGYNPRATYPGGNQPNSYPAPAPNQQGGYIAPAQPGGYDQNNGQGTYNNTPGTYPNDGSYPAPAGAAGLPPLAPADVAELTQDLRQYTTDAERLRAATDALAESSLRADELAELVKTFTHDESRIELGRFGYTHVSDPQNFERVYKALQFPSSVRTLRQLIGQPQN